jgi:hypothetical protein
VARIPLVDPDDPTTDPHAAALLKGMEAGNPAGLFNMQRVIANHPALAESFFNFATVAYFDSHLTPKQAELPYLTSAIAIDCFY